MRQEAGETEPVRQPRVGHGLAHPLTLRPVPDHQEHRGRRPRQRLPAAGQGDEVPPPLLVRDPPHVTDQGGPVRDLQ